MECLSGHTPQKKLNTWSFELKFCGNTEKNVIDLGKKFQNFSEAGNIFFIFRGQKIQKIVKNRKMGGIEQNFVWTSRKI